MFQTQAETPTRSLSSQGAGELYRRATLAVILITLALRVGVSPVFGLDFMESYGAVMARTASLSFFDQPPLTWWLIGAAVHLFGTDAAAAVRLPFILCFAGSSWLLFGIAERLYSVRAGFYAVCAFSFSPLFGIYDGGLAQTDCLMEFFVLAAVRCLIAPLFDHTEGKGAWAAWIGAGLCFGLALASKYTAVLLLPGLLAFLLTTGRETRRWLSRPQPYAAAVAAVLPLLPVLIWNAQHDWASFLYQGGRASPGDGLHVTRLLRWLGMQVLILQPPIYVLAVIAWVRGLARGPGCRPDWLLSTMAAVPFVLFPLVMVWSSHPVRGFHWGSTGYLLLFPMIGEAVDRIAVRRPRWRSGWLALSATTFGLVLLVLVSQAGTGWMAALAPKAFATQDPVLLELFDWTGIGRALKDRGVDPARTFVTATRWEECGKASYALKDSYDVLCLSTDNIHFSFIADPAAFAGKDAIVVDRYADLASVRGDLAGHFTEIVEERPILLDAFGRHMATLKTYRATGFDGTWVKAPPGSKGRQ